MTSGSILDRVQIAGNDVAGVVAGVETERSDDSLDEKSRTCQQHEREGELADDQRVTDAASTAPRGGRSAVSQFGVDVRPRGLNGRRGTTEKGRERRHQSAERKDAPVHAEADPVRGLCPKSGDDRSGEPQRPTTVRTMPFTVRVRPTTSGSAANRDFQSRSLSITTGSGPSRSSSTENPRPRAG